MTTSLQAVSVPAPRGARGWRAAAARVVANALLVMLAYGVVTLTAAAAAMIVQGWSPPVPPAEFALIAVVFVLVRWIIVLPGLLPVLVGIELVARRVPHARILTLLIALAPAVWWALSQSPDDVVFFAAIGALFAVLARLPVRANACSTDDDTTFGAIAENRNGPGA